jgi:TolA-binding protein
MRFAAAIAVVLAVVWAGASAMGADKKKKDIIMLVDGKTKEVPAVLEENFAHVKYRWGSGEQTLKITLVKQVVYYDAPDDFHTAMGLFSSKKYAEALAAFERAREAPSVRKWIQQYSLFFQGECLRKMGKTNKANFRTAVEKYQELLSTVPTTRFLPEALLYVGECQAYAGNYDKAVAAFRRLQTEQSKKALEPSWALKADLAEGRVLELKKDYMAAYHKFNSIYTMATRMGLTGVANKALLHKGLSLLKQKKFKEAERYFKDLFKNAKGEGAEVRSSKGGACIGLGHCYIEAKDLRKARFWFLRSMVVYFTSEDFHPEAMYFAGLCFHKLAKDEKGAKTRARAIFTELKRRYPESEWAKQVKGLGY